MYENLTPSDIQCPICLEVVILPVTLPCGHVFCETCLRRTVEHQAYTCPTCRKRIGVFLRKNKNIVNLQFWAAVQAQYPDLIHKRQNGEDTGVCEYINAETAPRLSYTPGEIREEFEKSLLEETEHEKVRRETEEKLSAELIKKLLEEEEKQEEENKKQLRIDEALARSFSEESTNVPKTSSNSKTFSVLKATTPARKLESYFQNTPTTSAHADNIDKSVEKTDVDEPQSPLLDLPSEHSYSLVYKADHETHLDQEEILMKAKENYSAYMNQITHDRLFALELQKKLDLEVKNLNKRTYDLRGTANKSTEPPKKIKKTAKEIKKTAKESKKNSKEIKKQRRLCGVGCRCCRPK